MRAVQVFILLMITVNGLSQPREIYLWPSGAPGSEGKTGREKIRIVENENVISNIHNPSITAYLPARNATGTAVIIAPGGGHRELWITHEGYNPAKWFSERGIAAFVLKYRLARDSNSTYTFLPNFISIQMQDMDLESVKRIRGAVSGWPERFMDWLSDSGFLKN